VASVAAVVDSEGGARWLSEAAIAAGVRVDVLVDVNVGQDRTGVEAEAAAGLAAIVSRLPGLRLRGLQGYEGHLQHVYDAGDRAQRVTAAMDRLEAARNDVAGAGHPVDWITTGGTGSFRLTGSRSFVTELQPGSYAVMDADYARVEDQPFEVALSILTTVIGTYAGRAVVDAGSKSVSTDAGQPLLKEPMGMRFTTAGDEHGKLLPDVRDPATLRVGSKVELIPSHCDTTVNLHDVFYVVSGGLVEDIWPIAARGRVQ
jgi:D-serine deaminase-like pyridoxal phosphate-dependent protein